MVGREYRFGKDHKLELVPTWFSSVAWCYDDITGTVEFVITDRLSFIAVNLSRDDVKAIWQRTSTGTLEQAISNFGKVIDGYYTMDNEEVQQYSSGGKIIKISDSIIQTMRDELNHMHRF